MSQIEQDIEMCMDLSERFALARERVGEIARGEERGLSKSLSLYFRDMAGFLMTCADSRDRICDGSFSRLGLRELEEENRAFYEDILPGHYESSYANPVYAVKVLGEEFGRILCFLYTELRSLRVCIFEGDLFRLTILYELFLEIYCVFCGGNVNYRRIRDVIYDFLYDYADEWVGRRTRQMVDPTLDFALTIVMQADLSDLSYLYSYGEYISENERQTARFLNSIPQERVEEIAATFTRGYQRGFALKGVDLREKTSVNIRYPIGFERVIRAAVRQFSDMGLSSVIYRYAWNTLNKNRNIKTGYQATSPNPQYDYDHRFDDAIYLDKRMVDRKISCMEAAFREYAGEAAGFAGPAVFEVFGEEPFMPVTVPEAYRLSERQVSLHLEYASLSNQVINRYINQEERSFTIISYPIPAIGDQFEEIFKAVHRINTLDNEEYRKIQQTMIDVLDTADYVKIMGRGKNMTNLTVALSYLDNSQTQTKFENCLSDVNIPLGEVFTSPRLYGTEGLLHVRSVYLNGLFYEDLKLTFERGMVTDYSCGNFADPKQGRRYIEENILFGRKSLPMGEFAIGTNTTAYVVSRKYNLARKMPILIAEKMGPHIAVGDTCYAYCEDVKVYNPDGKEMIARENECSAMRHTDLKKAYFNCHTDITIPYEDIGRLVAVTPDRVERPLIMNGRFMLEGTFSLNEPFSRGVEEDHAVY